jgi:hypothetical protein
MTSAAFPDSTASFLFFLPCPKHSDGWLGGRVDRRDGREATHHLPSCSVLIFGMYLGSGKHIQRERGMIIGRHLWDHRHLSTGEL